MNLIVKTEETRKSFYPTPAKLAAKMLEGIKWNSVETVLEPSAGKGDLILAIPEAMAHYIEIDGYSNYREKDLVVHAIEIDPYLRGAIKPAINDTHEEVRKLDSENSAQCRALYQKRLELTEDEKEELREMEHFGYYLSMKNKAFDNLEVNIVHDDFTTFDSYQKYDLILMNPPFSNGCQHLLQAIKLAERYGSQIRCLLNAETIQNAYTNDRKELIKILEMYQADISILPAEFTDAERETDVTVALIKVDIPAPVVNSDIWSRMKKASEEQQKNIDCEALSVMDVLEDAIAHYKVETEAGIKLIKEYLGMRPYLMDSLDEDRYSKCILQLRVGDRNDLEINSFLRKVRLKYWTALFQNKKVMGKMTSEISQKYTGLVRDLQDYEFSMFNIQQLFAEMNAELKTSIEDTIFKLFDEMSAEHSYYDNSTNVHYYNGWKTNKAHRINQKVILPAYSMFYSWNSKLDKYKAYQIISDIEKVFDYFDGNMTASVNLSGLLETAEATGNTRNIPCKYFTLTIYKKGTMHIKFTNMKLLERFNIYCSKGKAWLPPDYGTHTYEEMSDEAKAVVDSFNGDGSSGSGRKAYENIMAKAGYYLQSPVSENAVLMLGQ